MSVDVEIRRLLERWDALAEQGRPSTLEHLCQDRPELLPELKRRLIQRENETPPPLAATVAAPSPGRALLAAPPCVAPSIPGYEILGEVGRGAMGVVYKARQVALNRMVALKMIRDSVLAGPQQLDDFRREAEAVAQLRHPGIVHVYEFGIHNGLPFFSMELVEGGSLADKLRGRSLPPMDAARLVVTLARAIHHAHQQRIIHRDLKPANILLAEVQSPKSKVQSQEEGRRPSSREFELWTAKITDFGLAKRLDHAPSTHGGFKGTPNYMAPEQAADAQRKVGPAIDIYALGAVLYELLAGRPPFVGRSLADVLDQLRFHHPQSPSAWKPGLPADIETICLKCLEKEPAKRYATAEELAQDLDAFLNGEPIKGRTSGDQVGARLDKLLRPSKSLLKPWITKVGLELQTTVERGDGVTVYRGRLVESDRPVHIKVVSSSADEAKRCDLIHEAAVLARLEHPGLPRFRMAGEQDGHQYLVCDWTEGINLRHHALQSRPAPAEVARLMESLCHILDYAHCQGFVHHDLRPENVLCTAEGMKVLNIGLPRPPDETADPSQSQLLNILRYKAPEQMDAEPAPVTVGVNVYTLGTILYEMLTATSVFPMRSLFSAMEQLRNQKPLPPSQLQPLLPAGLDAVCLKCLEKSPAQRHPTAAALADELRRFRG